MKRFVYLFLVLSVSLILEISLPAQEKYQSLIKGRVIDDRGQSVENAHIRLGVPETLLAKLCGAEEFSAWSDKEGKFELKEHCGVINRTIFLYIVPPLPDKVIYPIYPPFDAIRRNNPNFAGLVVNINGNQEINMGDVQIQIYFNTIDLFILDKNNQPYFKNEDEWADFKLLVKDENGRFAGSGAFSISDYQQSVNHEKSSIKLALPEGRWQFELLKEWEDYDSERNKTKSYLAKTQINVRKDEPSKPVRLTVAKKK